MRVQDLQEFLSKFTEATKKAQDKVMQFQMQSLWLK